MDYGDFSNPKGGYQPSDPGSRNTGVATRSPLTNKKSTPSKGKIGEFTELMAQNGVGKYHINHFIGYFKEPPFGISNLVSANNEFYKFFVGNFSDKNVAFAEWGTEKYKGNATVEFKLGGNLGSALSKIGGEYHSDWVAMQKEDDGKGFYASTLKREWYEDKELKAIAQLSLVHYVINVLGNDKSLLDKLKSDKKSAAIAWNYALHLLEVNQHHFLAGRRFFSIGRNESKKLYFIETAAFERNSVCEYNVLDNTGALRESIISLWTNLIINFQKGANVKLIDLSNFINDNKGVPKVNPNQALIAKNYYVKNNVAYMFHADKSADTILSTDWFIPLIKNHSALIKDFNK